MLGGRDLGGDGNESSSANGSGVGQGESTGSLNGLCIAFSEACPVEDGGSETFCGSGAVRVDMYGQNNSEDVEDMRGDGACATNGSSGWTCQLGSRVVGLSRRRLSFSSVSDSMSRFLRRRLAMNARRQQKKRRARTPNEQRIAIAAMPPGEITALGV